jgi:hypothetical protein
MLMRRSVRTARGLSKDKFTGSLHLEAGEALARETRLTNLTTRRLTNLTTRLMRVSALVLPRQPYAFHDWSTLGEAL